MRRFVISNLMPSGTYVVWNGDRWTTYGWDAVKFPSLEAAKERAEELARRGRMKMFNAPYCIEEVL